MATGAAPPLSVCLSLTRGLGRARTLAEIYGVALDTLTHGLLLSRAAVLLFDSDGVMRFKASRGLSDTYCRAVEGHTPWSPDTPDPAPIAVADVTEEPALRQLLPAIVGEGIAAMVFVPMVSLGRVIGKFMLYSDTPRAWSDDELELVGILAAQVGFAITRVRAEEAATEGRERLRFALDAGSMATWEWQLSSQLVMWSDNFERLHGLARGTLDGSFQSYERNIHPDDRDAVRDAQRRAIVEGIPYHVEYRVVGPDGAQRWVEAQGRVDGQSGTARISGVCMIVTRRKEAELARLAAAEESSRVKDEFLATVSHELRSPLNAIAGWVQLLERHTSRGTGMMAQAVAVIKRNATMQAQLIEDILDVARIGAGRLGIERHPVSVATLVEAVLTALFPAAAAKKITLTRECPDQLPLIEGDPRRLHQVLSNIVSNAIKFTPEAGSVRVSCRAEPEAVVIEVRDSGVGIRADFLPLVFERFRQADNSTSERRGGLGLGLAIARHLVEQHGGDLRVESDGPGCGSTFVIRLPVVTDQAHGAVIGSGAASPALLGGSSANRLEESRLSDVIDDTVRTIPAAH